MVDHVLARIHAAPAPTRAPLVPIPWPEGMAPRAPAVSLGDRYYYPAGPLYKWGPYHAAIVTWTAAEWCALCDVLGVIDIHDYAHDFASYESELTDRSPARDAKCLARVATVEGPKGIVLLVHSMLHLATDSAALPLRRFFHQLLNEANPEVIITTGTAGGIGSDKQLGDVVIGTACRFFCEKQFKDAPFARSVYPTTLNVPLNQVVLAPLFAANAGRLPPRREPFLTPQVFIGEEIETTDRFAFDESDDRFGLRAYDASAGAIEMDDACLGLVIADRLAAGLPAPFWAAVRNVSDPEAMLVDYADQAAAAKAMAAIYTAHGYDTTVPSAIVSWLMANGGTG